MAAAFGNINIISNISKYKLEPGNGILNNTRLLVNIPGKVPLTGGGGESRK